MSFTALREHDKIVNPQKARKLHSRVKKTLTNDVRIATLNLCPGLGNKKEEVKGILFVNHYKYLFLGVVSFLATLPQCEVTINFSFNKKCKPHSGPI